MNIDEKRERIFDEVLQEMSWCMTFIKEKLETLDRKDLDHPDMKAIDYVHDACHTRMVPQGGRGPIESLSQKRAGAKVKRGGKIGKNKKEE